MNISINLIIMYTTIARIMIYMTVCKIPAIHPPRPVNQFAGFKVFSYVTPEMILNFFRVLKGARLKKLLLCRHRS